MYVVIAGCGRVGAQLATILSDLGHNVVIIDSDSEAFHRLGSGFNGQTLVGNGFDEDVLRKAGADGADIFIAVTEFDNANIMAGQVARKLFNISRVVARVYYPDREQTYHKLGLETICGPAIVAERIAGWALGRELVAEIGLGFDSHIVEFTVNRKMAGMAVRETETIEGFRPFALFREGRSLVANGDMMLKAGDTVLAIAQIGAEQVVAERFGVTLVSKTISGLSCPLVTSPAR